MERNMPDRVAGDVLGSHDQLTSNRVVRYFEGRFQPTIDTVAQESPLAVYLNGRKAAHAMRTPGADRDLAVGLLLTSGRIPQWTDFKAIEFQESDAAIRLLCPDADGPAVPFPEPLPPLGLPMAELAEQLLDMRAVLEERQRLHRHTGATHCAMFFDQDCAPLSVGEDVGRHNAFDKCVGGALRQGMLDRAHHAVITSRLSHEIVSKAIWAGVRVLAGFSVATSIAVDLAREHCLTLAGRLKDETMIIYE